MKITHVKFPVLLERTPEGIKMTIDESKKEVEKEEELGHSTQDIVTLSKRLSDENEMQKTVLKNSLFASEDKSDTTIVLKFLSE